MIQIFILILLGLLTGVLCGLVGIGGGLVIIPFLIYLFGFSQHMAQGTTIAMMVPPIGLLAAITYYKQGYVDIKTAIFIGIGIFIGAYLGSKIAVGLPDITCKKIFGMILFLVSIKMIFFK